MHQNFVPVSPTSVNKKELSQMNPLVLAFIGDSVQTLYVRTKLSISHTEKTGKLHLLATKELKATSQSIALKKIQGILSEEELAVYKRARNCKTSSSAKNASIIDYHIASGFEAVIGYHYLLQESQRIEELLEIAYLEDEDAKMAGNVTVNTNINTNGDKE